MMLMLKEEEEEETKKIVSMRNLESNKLHIKCFLYNFPITYPMNKIYSYNSGKILKQEQ